MEIRKKQKNSRWTGLAQYLRGEGFVTKDDLGGALAREIKASGLATKKDIDDIFHENISEFYVGKIVPEFDKLRGEMNTRFDKVDTEITFIKRDISDIKADLSLTPSREEFTELKAKLAA